MIVAFNGCIVLTYFVYIFVQVACEVVESGRIYDEYAFLAIGMFLSEYLTAAYANNSEQECRYAYGVSDNYIV